MGGSARPAFFQVEGLPSGSKGRIRLGRGGAHGFRGHHTPGSDDIDIALRLPHQLALQDEIPIPPSLFVLIGALTSWGSVDQMGVGRVVNVPCGWDGRVGACGQARKRGERPTRQTPAAWVAPLGDAKSRFSWIPVLSASRNLIKTCYNVRDATSQRILRGDRIRAL